jgi:hypothetical protein
MLAESHEISPVVFVLPVEIAAKHDVDAGAEEPEGVGVVLRHLLYPVPVATQLVVDVSVPVGQKNGGVDACLDKVVYLESGKY